MNHYKITTQEKSFIFTGKYRKDLDTDFYYYYEKEDGTLIGFKKEDMVSIANDGRVIFFLGH